GTLRVAHPPYAATAADIARLAGKLLLEFFQRGVETEYKGTGTVDLVTEADRASEALIAQELQGRFPTHSVLGEEGTRREQAGDKASEARSASVTRSTVPVP